MTITQIANMLASYPKKVVFFSATDTNIPAGGTAALSPSDFGLDTIDQIIFTSVEITGQVNVQTLSAKYDPVTKKVFYFGMDDDTSTTVKKPLAVTLTISAVPVVYGFAIGNDINN